MGREAPVVSTRAVEVGSDAEHQQVQNPDNRAVTHTQTSLSTFPWGSLAKWVGGIGAIGGVVLHLLGYISHQAYLEAWGIAPGLFPKPTDATLINGYYAFVERSVTLISAVKQVAGYLWWAVPAMSLYLFIILRLGKPSKNSKIRHKTQQPSGWISDFFKSLILTISTLAGVPIALVFAVLFFAVPAILGQNVGQTSAMKEMALFKEGCDAQPSGRRCIDIRKDGKTLARGFPIESSESNIALFDVIEKRARVLERDGTELLVDPTRDQPDAKK